MQTASVFPGWAGLLVALGTAGLPSAQGQAPWRFTGATRTTSAEVTLQFTAPAGATARLETSTNLTAWVPLATLRSAGANEFTDAGAPWVATRFYRVREVEEPGALTGDHLVTNTGDVVIHPVNHASLVLGAAGGVVYVDPVGGAGPYAGLPRADVVLVTHSHSDHYHAATLEAVRGEETVLVVPAAVHAGLPAGLKARATALANGQSVTLPWLTVEAVPAYNANHPKGAGNGYVVRWGDRRLYFSGDTGDTPEMRALPGIDVAFICMNVPYTMTVAQAAAVVRAFRPAVVYPYHFRNQDGTFADLESFRRQVRLEPDPGIEVRVRRWY